ncbi:MAG: hypothetical protein QXH26_02435 [Candidatus Hadarchaeales archaeon]
MIVTKIEKVLTSSPKTASSPLRALLQELEEMEGGQEFEEVRHRLRREAWKFLENLHQSRNSILREDWLRLADYNLRKVKEELLRLKEVLARTEVRSTRFDPTKLLKEIRQEGAMSEATWLMLANHPDLRKCHSREVRTALARLSSLLQELRRVRNG